MTKSKNIQSPRFRWTAEKTQRLQEQYQNTLTADIAQALGCSVHQVYYKAYALGIHKSEEFFLSELSGRTTGNRGGCTRFKKNHASWNKGLKGLQYEGSKATQFTHGQSPKNVLPVGHIRPVANGYLEIKTAPGMRKWVLLHRWNWKLAHGEFPPKGMAIAFKDGNKTNCDISNLELISRTDLMKSNSVHNLPKELATLVQLRGALNRQINRRSKDHE